MQFAALQRAWHRKTRRPSAAAMVEFDPDFFREPDSADANGQKAFAAGNPALRKNNG